MWRPLGGGKGCPGAGGQGRRRGAVQQRRRSPPSRPGGTALCSLAERGHAHGEKVLPVPSTSKQALHLQALQLQLVPLLKPPCLQGLRKYRTCLTSSTNVKHKWSWVDGSSPLKHAFETLQFFKAGLHTLHCDTQPFVLHKCLF